METGWQQGYPQPESVPGFLAATYDLSAYCPCGIGAIQKAPFRIARPPRWGRRSIMQLFWVHDEFFVTPALWSEVFRPFGIGKRPVILHQSGIELDSIVQLAIEADADANLNGVQSRACSFGQCSGRKYLPIESCGFPEPVETPAPLFRSRQFFGDGAYRIVWVTMPLYARLMKAQARGARFDFCKTPRPTAKDRWGVVRSKRA